MLTHAVRRLVSAVLLALPVLGGLWATSGPAALAAPWPFPTPACSSAQTGFGTGTAQAAGSGTVFFSPTIGGVAIFPGGVPQESFQGGMSWNFTTQLTNGATGDGSMTASLRVVVNGVPGLGTLTFTPSCLQVVEVRGSNALLVFQGTATGFGQVTGLFQSARDPLAGNAVRSEFALAPPGNACQILNDRNVLLSASTLGGQITANVSGGFNGQSVLTRTGPLSNLYCWNLAPLGRL